MKSVKENIRPFISKIIPAILPVFIIYQLWGFASYLFLNFGILLKNNGASSQYLIPVSIIFFIILASFITMLFMVYVEKHIEENVPVRCFWLSFTLLIWALFYIFVTITGNKINLLYCFSTANLIVFSCILGNWMTTPVKRPVDIVPLCVVVAFSDLFSVFAGPTKYLAESISVYYEGGMQGTPPFVDYILVKIALPGIDTLMPVFGVSDWIIIAFLSAVACKFQMNDNLTGKALCRMKKKPGFLFFPVASSGLMISIVVAQTTNFFIPALPFVVFVFLSFMMIKYPAMRKLTKTELIPMAAFSGLMILLMVFHA